MGRTSWTYYLQKGLRSLHCRDMFLFKGTVLLYGKTSKYMFTWLVLQLSFAIITILRGHPDGFLCHFGIKCSSWSTVNVGTSSRSFCTPVGNTLFRSVRTANTMASRSTARALATFCIIIYYSYIAGKGSWSVMHTSMRASSGCSQKVNEGG